MLKEKILLMHTKNYGTKINRTIPIRLSIRAIAEILESSTKTIEGIDRLEIEEFWKFNGGGKYLHNKFTDTEEFKIKRKDLREKWLELHSQHPNKSSNQMRKDNDGVYAWLKKYDSEWIEKHYRRIDNKVNPVNWENRDAELLTKVKEVIKDMKEGKPEQITWTTVGSKLGISGWLSKKKEKLPLTKAFVEPQIESLEEYHIRKIKWGIEGVRKTRKGSNVMEHS